MTATATADSNAVSTGEVVQADVEFSAEQVAAFHRDGFLRIERITGDDEVERLHAIFERLFAARAGRERGEQFDLAGADEDGKPEGLPQILAPSAKAPELRETLYHANGLALSRQVLGDGPISEVRWGGDHAILKPARYGKTTPWHQDEAYWDPMSDARGLSIWMPLQRATVENGCLWFVPGSHRGEILEHQSIGNDVRVHGLETLVADTRAAVPVPLAAGGAVIFHCRTLHYAGPNTTDQSRYAYTIGYHRPGIPRATRRHVPWQDRKQTAREARAQAVLTAAAKTA